MNTTYYILLPLSTSPLKHHVLVDGSLARSTNHAREDPRNPACWNGGDGRRQGFGGRPEVVFWRWPRFSWGGVDHRGRRGIGRAQVRENSELVMATKAGCDGGYGGLVWRIGLRWRTGNQLHTQVAAAVARRTVLATDSRLKWWREYHLYIEIVFVAAAVVVWRTVLATDGRLKWWRGCRLYIEVVSAVVVAVTVTVAVWRAVLAWDSR